jgi:hypothetical protein
VKGCSWYESGWETQAGIEKRDRMGKASNCEREYFSIGMAKRDDFRMGTK